jgi:hypothetical protein
MTHPNFPYQNDPEDLMDYMIIMMNDMKTWKTNEKKIKKAMLKLIRECKSEWCKEQRGNCAKAYSKMKGSCHLVSDIVKTIKNAPEP